MKNRIHAGWRLIAALLLTALLTTPPAAAATADVESVLDHLQAHYDFPGFSARFHQESTIKAMDITDTADGQILVKRPDKIRWDYETPEPQTIIADGDRLWIYRPEDEQMMIGRTPDVFGQGKGATFLADLKTIRDHFTASMESDDGAGPYRLKLTPKKSGGEIATVFLTVARDSVDITTVETVSAYGDRTRIELSEFWWQPDLSAEQFKINPPPNTEIITLDQ